MRLPAVLIAVGLVCCPALPAIAQEGTPSAAIQPQGGAEVLGTVVRGNTTIIFQAAGTHGLDFEQATDLEPVRRGTSEGRDGSSLQAFFD